MSSVPAWKRLGLKLKGPAPAPAPNPQSSWSGSQASSHGGPHHTNGLSLSSPSFANKRKLPPTPSSAQKKVRYDPSESYNGGDYDNSSISTPALKKRKSVTFAPDTKLDVTTPSATWTPATTHRQRSLVNGSRSSPAPANKSKPKKKKKTKCPPKKLKPVSAPNLDTALSYLRTWKTDRANWKFNKNHQTSLLRHLLSPPDAKTPSNSTIPAEDIPTLLEYIQGLKGFVRTRLREAAEEVKKADMAPYNSTHTGFPEGTKDVAARQAEYDDLIQTFLTQPTTPRFSNPRYSFSFSETEFHRNHAETNTLVARRVVKRMRAEMVLDAIASDSDASEASAASHGTEATAETRDNEQGPTDKRIKLNDGTLQRVKRRRKLRTANVESDSSSDESSSGSDSENDADSESESDSEEEAGDDGDDDDDDDDDDEDTSSSEDDTSSSEEEEVEGQEGPAEMEDTTEDAETSSSSSESSSSSDSESDGDGAEGTEKMDVVHAHKAHETSSSSDSSNAGDDSD